MMLPFASSVLAELVGEAAKYGGARCYEPMLLSSVTYGDILWGTVCGTIWSIAASFE